MESATADTTTEKTAVSQVAKWVEQLLKIAGIFAVFGYMSLRAHWNYLGLSELEPIGIERLLMETYPISLKILFEAPARLVGLPVALAAGAAVVLWRAAQRFFNLNVRFRTAIRSVETASRSPIPPVLLSIVAVAAIRQALVDLGEAGVSVAMGPLGNGPPARPSATGLFDFILVFSVLGIALSSAIYRNLSERRLWRGAIVILWRVFQIALALTALHLPLLYGVLLRPTNYVVAEADLDNGSHVCGALVGESDNAVRLWRASGKTGSVVVVAHAKLYTLSNSIDIPEEARRAAKGASTPICLH
jgi:hypothetical protein